MAEAAQADGEHGEGPPRRKRRNLLKLYYGVSDAASPSQVDVRDINSPHFQSEAFMEDMLKNSTLAQLMDKEEEMRQRECICCHVSICCWCA